MPRSLAAQFKLLANKEPRLLDVLAEVDRIAKKHSNHPWSLFCGGGRA